uniref:Bromodomain and WD repeat domain containing 1 n=1 Tax=Leptobrachium leishanense TaxID=445787 RepID=A0A8C5M0Z6_9ANUR
MAEPPGPSLPRQPLESELYFLIARFLANGPCRTSAKMLMRELNDHNLLPQRIDWLGNEHAQTFEDMASHHSRVAPDHLLRLCQQLLSLLNEELPPAVPATSSLIDVGPRSVLCRSGKDCRNIQWNLKTLAALHSGRPPEVPGRMKRMPNVVNVHYGKHLTGMVRLNPAFPVSMYQHVKLKKKILGHLSPVYCVAFDRTGERIFTGSDDCLLKVWSTLDGRLLASLRGHSAEISELAVNYENTLIATTSCEKLIRVWSLRTGAPVTVLQGHSVSVNSLIFSPLVRGSARYLISAGGDATVCLWQWDVDSWQFNDRPVKFVERSGPTAKLLCCSCSAGGMFLAAGGSDHMIRMYYFGREAPEKTNELEGHMGIIDSIQFSNHSERFLSGSSDGTVRIWHLENQEWSSLTLDMSQQLKESSTDNEQDLYGKQRVFMLAWNVADTLVVTATSSRLLKVWDSHNGKLLHVLTGHQNDIYVLEPHPLDPRIVLSAGYDGNVCIWDITKGVRIKHHVNVIEGQGQGAILDCKLSADGQHVAATDSQGHLLIFGFGCSKMYEKVPDQMFYHTDYRPLCRDANNWVLDEQTQQAPHLMPPPFLVDADGNPHPLRYQRLVPGREDCADEQLIPQLGYAETSYGEIVEQVIGQQGNVDAGVLNGIIQDFQRAHLQNRNPEREPGSNRELPTDAMPQRDNVAPSRGDDLGDGIQDEGALPDTSQVPRVSPQSQESSQCSLPTWKCRIVVPQIPFSIYKKQEEFRIAKGNEEKARIIKQKTYDFQENYEVSYRRRHSRPKTRARSSRRDVEEFLDLSCEEGEESSENVEEEESMDQITEDVSSVADDDWDDENDDSRDSSSEHSDWTIEARTPAQPSPRASRTRTRKLPSTSSWGSSGEEEPPRPRKKSVKQKKQNELSDPAGLPVNGEILDYRPPAWITDTMPHRSPFVPQMGDKVIYFRQGHEAYINAVTRNNLGISTCLEEPWNETVLRDQEVAKIIAIHYEVAPPVLCCLKLALIDHVSGKLTDRSFCLKYHDMPDVIDFLVLRQFYDRSCKTNWKAGDKFRSIIDDAWWFGTVVSQEPYQADYPDSLFQCYTVQWDNSEMERLSPWDMDLVPDDVNRPSELGASVSVTPDELENLYVPQEGDWGKRTLESECERIIFGIEQLGGLDLAVPFKFPVDLNIYPTYSMVVAYPTDLGTIKTRLMNRFYRRVSALTWEVRLLEINARTFNEPESSIAKSAKTITDLLIKFIKASECVDIIGMHTSTEGSEQGTSSVQPSKKKPGNEDPDSKKQSTKLVDQNVSSVGSFKHRETFKKGTKPPAKPRSSHSTSGASRSSKYDPSAAAYATSSATNSDAGSSLGSSSESETDSKSSTSASEHSSRSSSESSVTGARNKPPSRSKEKAKGSNDNNMTNATAKPASQEKRPKNKTNKKRSARSSDYSSASGQACRDTRGLKKKMPRKSAALAANRLKNMSGVEDSACSSDSDYSASKINRKLPHRTAAAEAKKRLHCACEEENSTKSDSETGPSRWDTRLSPTKLESDSSAHGSNRTPTFSPQKSSTDEESSFKGYSEKHKSVVQNVSEPSLSDSRCSVPCTSIRRHSFESEVEMSSSQGEHQTSPRKNKLRKRQSGKRARTKSLTISDHSLGSQSDVKLSSHTGYIYKKATITSSNSESDTQAPTVHRRRTSQAISSPAWKQKFYDSKGTSESESEDGSSVGSAGSERTKANGVFGSSDSETSASDPCHYLHDKTNREQCGSQTPPKRKSVYTSETDSSCIDVPNANGGKCRPSSESSDGSIKRRTLKKRHRSVCDDDSDIPNSRNLRKRLKVTYDEEDDDDSDVADGSKSKKLSNGRDLQDGGRDGKSEKSSDEENTDYGKRVKLTRRSKGLRTSSVSHQMLQHWELAATV